MKALAAAGVFSAVALIAWSVFAQTEAGPRRIEVTEPGVYKDSDCLYVMTKDVTAKGKGFRFEGKNYVVDLGGNTLTFNTEPYKDPNEKEYWLYKPVFGVMMLGEKGELRNGRIVQGDGHDKDARCVYVGVKGGRIHDTTTVISGGDMAKNFFAQWGGADIELDHNYIVNHGEAEGNWYGAITLSEAGTPWDIHHNTIVGGHQGILVGGRRDRENIHIHHNFISHKRTPGQKVPEAIYIRANGCEIDHNEVVTIDGRGLEPTGENNNWHHNVVDIRYTMKAEGGFYPENRCYGYWARNPNGNVISENLFVVNNEIIGDDTSSCIGVLLTTDPGRELPLRNCTVTGNRFFIHHNDKSRPACGFSLQHVGDQVVIRDNFVWADTAGVEVDDRSKGAIIEGNTFVRGGVRWKETAPSYQSKGEGLQACTFKDNKVVDPPSDKVAPAAPTGLAITPRLNGYELHWDANKEPDALGYYVYRDGKRVEERLKCGRFYVDTSADPKGKYSYAISAVDTSNNEGPKCAAVSTEAAK
jgi:hypothetical protein